MEKVQFISHFTEKYSYVDSVRLALEGGCKWIQLRMKDAPEDEIVETALEVRKMCDRNGAVLMQDWWKRPERTVYTSARTTCRWMKHGDC